MDALGRVGSGMRHPPTIRGRHAHTEQAKRAARYDGGCHASYLTQASQDQAADGRAALGQEDIDAHHSPA